MEGNKESQPYYILCLRDNDGPMMTIRLNYVVWLCLAGNGVLGGDEGGGEEENEAGPR